MNVGQEIKRLREEKPMTQRQLAEQIGVKQSHVAGLESGASNLSIKTLVLLCKALGVSADVFTSRMEFKEKTATPKRTTPKGKPGEKKPRPAAAKKAAA